MAVTSDISFPILLANRLNEPVHILRCINVSHVVAEPVRSIATEADLFGTDPETIVAVHYEPVVERRI